MIAPHDPDRRHREAQQRIERAMLGFATVLILVMASRVALAWAEGQL